MRGKASRNAQRVWPSLAGALGFVTLPAVYTALETWGPASRVTFRPYLPLGWFAMASASALIGLALGLEVDLALRPRQRAYRRWRLALGCCMGAGTGTFLAVGLALAVPPSVPFEVFLACVPLLIAGFAFAGGYLLFAPLPAGASMGRFSWPVLAAFAVLVGLWLSPQLDVFPTHGTVAERDAWTRAHVAEYPALVRLVRKLPELEQTLGPIVAMAPTAEDAHSYAGDMEGTGLDFTFEVVGTRGTGTLHVTCTLDHGTLVDWQPAHLTYHGATTTLATLPAPLRH